jgi:hypothetical protein
MFLMKSIWGLTLPFGTKFHPIQGVVAIRVVQIMPPSTAKLSSHLKLIKKLLSRVAQEFQDQVLWAARLPFGLPGWGPVRPVALRPCLSDNQAID